LTYNVLGPKLGSDQVSAPTESFTISPFVLAREKRGS
jgi:hypothetical protein